MGRLLTLGKQLPSHAHSRDEQGRCEYDGETPRDTSIAALGKLSDPLDQCLEKHVHQRKLAAELMSAMGRKHTFRPGSYSSRKKSVLQPRS
jgi:hypothetical protein